MEAHVERFLIVFELPQRRVFVELVTLLSRIVPRAFSIEDCSYRCLPLSAVFMLPLLVAL